MPKWRNKIGEFDSPDKVFPVRAEFNRAYDEGCCNWERRPMILSKEDLDAFEDTTKPGLVSKFLENEKVVFVY